MEAMRFSLGVDYWPRSSAMAMWRRFDAGEVREDFARIAGLGLDTVRLFLRWDDFQPAADRADPLMLERLEAVVALAAEAGLLAVPVLFCGHASGVNWLPAWALDRKTPAGRFRTIAGEAESPFGCGDLYGGKLLDAQLSSPARSASGCARIPPSPHGTSATRSAACAEPSHAKVSTGEHSPVLASERTVADWSRRLTEALHETSALPVTAGTHAEDVTTDRSIRLGSLCAPFAFASMQGDTVHSAFARSRLDPEAVPFLAMLAAGFSHQPVLVTGFGNPTCPPDKFSAFERFPPPGEPPELDDRRRRHRLRDLSLSDRARERRVLHGRARAAARRRASGRVLVVLGRLSPTRCATSRRSTARRTSAPSASCAATAARSRSRRRWRRSPASSAR